MTTKFIIKKLQEMYDNYLNHIKKVSIVFLKKKEVKIGDMFLYIDIQEYDVKEKYYRLLEHNEKLYFIKCDNLGYIDYEIDFSKEKSLNDMKLKELNNFLKHTTPFVI